MEQVPAMETVLQDIARYVALGLDAVAVLIVVIGALEAVFGTARVMLVRRSIGTEKRAVWISFARWLVAALTFQLAADIVHTTITPTWDDIGRMAAVAAVRTFLTYFLDRDLEQMRERQHAETPGELHAETT
jgi:uncharacterized membrane protein